MKTVLLKHKNWIILSDGNFPSSNYCVFNVLKARKWNEKGELPAYGVAYCSNIQNALTSLFQQMINEQCRDKDYNATLTSLSDAIKKAKDEFDALITPEILKEIRHDENKKLSDKNR